MAAPLRRALTHARRFPEPFWALVGGSAVQSLGSGVLVPYWGLYLTSELHASGAAAGALLAAAGAMGLVGAPLGGYLTDRLGRRPTLVLGLGGTALWFALYGAIHSVPWLFALTILFPPTGDVWPAATSAATADLLAPGLRAEGYGLQRQAQMAAFALGPPLGALLVTALSLRWVFWAPALGNALFLLVVVLRVPETKPPLAEGERQPRMRQALRDTRLLLLTLGTGIGIMVYVQFDSVLGVFLHRERGYSLAAWGLVFGISPVLVATTQLFVARWAGRRSPRAMLAFGVVLEGAALCALWPTSVLPVLVVAVVAVTAGEMIVQPIASTVAAALAPPSLRGAYEAVVGVAFAASWAPAVFAGLWLVGTGHGEVMLAAALPLSLLGALCFRRLPSGGATDDREHVLDVAVGERVGEPAS